MNGSVLERSPEVAQADLLGALYAASTDPVRWQAFIERVSHWFGGRTGLYVGARDEPSRSNFIAGDNDPEMYRAHNEHYFNVCPWFPHIARSNAVVDVSDAFLSTDEFLRTEYYDGYMRPQGCLHWAGIRPALGSDQRFGLGVIRSPRRGPFTADEQRLLATLSEHLGRAGEIARRLDLFEAQSRAASAVLADLNAGVLLVDADMNVAFENAIAEALLIADDGLIVRGGRLRAATPRLDAPLREAVRRATARSDSADGFGSTLALPRVSGAPPLSLTVSPLDERDRPGFPAAPLALLVIGVPERESALDPERLRAAFDLTSAEARLAVALCAGRSIADHAEETGISLNTVKFHLKSVFDKSGEARQTDLVRRLIANPALRGGDAARRLTGSGA